MKDKELLNILRQDITWAHHEFDLYKKLYQNSEEVHELLNYTAHNFFIELQGILADRCILNISRLTDPYKQKGFKNMSLNLLKEIGQKNGWENLNEIENALDEIDELTSKVRDQRNKLKAHKDIDTIENPTKLDKITLNDLETIFTKIGDLMNIYYLNEKGYQWDWYPKSPGGVDALLNYLDMGRKFESEYNSKQ